MMKPKLEARWVVGLLSTSLWATACGGTASDHESNTGDGDGDVAGDGDTGGDGDVVGVGGTLGDGDVGGDGDGAGVGGSQGDGDVGGDGDVVGVGGSGIVCTDVYLYGLNVVLIGAAYPPPPDGNGADTEPAPGAPVPPEGDPIVPPPSEVPDPVPALPCEGSVAAVDGDYVETLACQAGTPRDMDCTCFGAGERPGTYAVTATWGNVTETQNVTLGFDGCHVMAQNLIFFED